MSQATPSFLALLMCMALLGAAIGCAASPSTSAHPTFEVGQIYDVSRQESISFKELLPHILSADVIFLGEEHYTPSHLQAAQKILDTLLAHQRHPVLAMEMFSWDAQPALDRYLQEPGFTAEQLRKASFWDSNWGGEFADYQPLVTFAHSHQLRIVGLNPPRPLVRLVATQGLQEARQNPEMRKWPMKELVTDDPEYENLIFEQIEACHPGLPDHVYRRIFEASIFRDEGMAQVISDYLTEKPPTAGPMVSYTGGGHIQYNIPIPKRVARKHPDTEFLTIHLETWHPSKEDDIRSEMKAGIADFLWLTSLGPKGLQPGCG